MDSGTRQRQRRPGAAHGRGGARPAGRRRRPEVERLETRLLLADAGTLASPVLSIIGTIKSASVLVQKATNSASVVVQGTNGTASVVLQGTNGTASVLVQATTGSPSVVVQGSTDSTAVVLQGASSSSSVVVQGSNAAPEADVLRAGDPPPAAAPGTSSPPSVVVQGTNGTPSIVVQGSSDSQAVVVQGSSATPTPPPKGVQVTGLVEASVAAADLPGLLRDAQDLPPERDLEVNGSLDPLRSVAMYRIPIDPGTSSLRIEIRSDLSSQPCIEALTLLDESGHKLMEQVPLPGTLALGMNVPDNLLFTPGVSRHAFYLKVSAPTGLQPPTPSPAAGTGGTTGGGTGTGTGTTPTPTPTPDATGFVLTVKRDTVASAGPRSGWMPTVDGSVPTAVSASGAAGAPTGISAAAREEVLTTASVAAARAPVPVGVATGPLPSLSAAPLGGILSGSNDPTPAVSPDDTVVIDLALQDLPPRGGRPEVRAAAAADDPAAGDGGDVVASAEGAVVTLSGPGGVPLLGSTLVATVRAAEPPAVAVAPAVALAPPVERPVEDRPERSTSKRGGRAGRSVGRASVAAAMSVALAFVTGLALPDLTDPTRAGANPRGRVRIVATRRGPRAGTA